MSSLDKATIGPALSLMICGLRIGEKRGPATMETTGGKRSEIQKLAKLISDPGRRKAFARDPEDTLAAAGIDVGGLPEGVRSTLFDLSHEELRVLSRVKDSLRQAGVSREDEAEIF